MTPVLGIRSAPGERTELQPVETSSPITALNLLRPVLTRSSVWGWRTRTSSLHISLRKKYEPAAEVTAVGRNFTQGRLFSGARANRVGIRYGKEILPGSDVMKKQSLIGAFCDLQHGPGAGWRLFADRIPEVTGNENGQSMSLSSDRYSIGFAISVAPGFLIQRIDVTPRVGFWNMTAEIPFGVDETTGESTVETFSVRRAGSGGVEAGIEFGDGINALRFWGSMDRGVSLLGGARGSARASRVGLDVFLPINKGFVVGDATEIKPLVQLFGFLESIAIEGSSSSDSSSSGSSVDGIEYIDGFVGAGLGVTW